MKFEKVVYSELNAKAQEMYNFQKVSAKLADYGFTTIWLNNDWQGADFIGVHANGVTDIKVQLKGRLSFSKMYIGKNIYMCLISDDGIYFYLHDEVLNQLDHRISDKKYIKTGSWSTSRLTKQNKQLLEPYLL
jgi:hypothetical protein